MDFLHKCSVFTYIHTYPHDRDGRRGALEDLWHSVRQATRLSAILISSSSFFPVQFLMFSIQLFLCLPLFLDPFTVPWRIVLESVWWRVTWPNQAIFLLFTVVSSSSCLPTFWQMVAFTYSLVFLSFHDIPSRRRKHFISNDWILDSSSVWYLESCQMRRFHYKLKGAFFPLTATHLA